eukprot:Skav210414  [mRNA]  locus=scaffold1573:25831:39082:- [translate_table: standard]
MGSRGSKEIHHYHEDHESKKLAQQATQQVEILNMQMAEQQRLNEEALRQRQRQHEEALRQAEQLQAEERAEALRRLNAEQENRRQDHERAQAQLAHQKQEAEEKLVQELQRERDNLQKAKLEKWRRLKRDYPIPDFLKDYVNEVSESADADAAQTPFVNVAMIGNSGTGKSSLIKVILRLFGVDLPPDQMPEVSMEGDGTLVPTRFPLNILGKVSLWDLPGQGTSSIPSMTYLCNMGLKYFDAVCDVTDGRWSEGDDSLLAAIHYADIRCFVLRTKVDLAVEAGIEDKGWSQGVTLNHVRRQLQRQTRLKPQRIHLVTSREKFWPHFGAVNDFCQHLRQEVEASLRGEPAEQMPGSETQSLPLFRSWFVTSAACSPKTSREIIPCAQLAQMGSRGSKEIHHYHEDHESKKLAQQATQQVEILNMQMAEQQRLNEEALRQRQRQHEEALRQAEQLQAEERAEALRRLNAEQENRRQDHERAQAQLAHQKQEAEEKLVQELQRERDNLQKAKLEKWRRLKRDYPIPDFLKDYVNEVSESADADAAQTPFVNVAMIGNSGTGKSSLIKVILRLFGVDLPPDQMPEVSMEGDGTLVPTRFPLNILGKVSLWDLPGQGTSSIPSMTYLCNMGLKYFDAVCDVTDGRWSEGDDSLLAAIHYADIRCFVLRTKVDLAVEAGIEDKGWSQGVTLNHVRRQLQRQTRLKPQRIHLVTSREKFWPHFGAVNDFCQHLRQEVEASLQGEPAEQMFEAITTKNQQPQLCGSSSNPGSPQLGPSFFLEPLLSLDGAKMMHLARSKWRPRALGTWLRNLNTGVLKEAENEKRVSMVPSVAEKLIAKGYKISVEAGAGAKSGIPDSAYEAVGCSVVSRNQLKSSSELLFAINPPPAEELGSLSGDALRKFQLGRL